MEQVCLLVCGRNRSRRRVFQRMDAATGSERRPTVVRQYAGTCSRCDEDERRRWRPGRSEQELADGRDNLYSEDMALPQEVEVRSHASTLPYGSVGTGCCCRFALWKCRRRVSVSALSEQRFMHGFVQRIPLRLSSRIQRFALAF